MANATHITHRNVLVITSSLTSHHVAMDVGYHDLGARDVGLKLRNDDAGFHDIATNVGNSSMCASRCRRK